MRKPHERWHRLLLRLLLVGLGCCLVPQFGPGLLLVGLGCCRLPAFSCSSPCDRRRGP